MSECVTAHEGHRSLFCFVGVRASSHLHATAQNKSAATGIGIGMGKIKWVIEGYVK